VDVFKASASGIGIALILIYAIGSGIWVSSANAWYRSLNSPSWQPPDWLFGVIWPCNFIVLGLTAFLVGQRLSKAPTITWLAFLALSVLSALTWAFLFYQPHNLKAAAISLVVAALLNVPVVFIAFNASIAVGIALIPYQVWLVLASGLSIGYARLN
jgi:tryptophan-rich sensory protein